MMVMREVRRTGKGKFNKLIDEILHPYFKQYPAPIIVDGLLHAMVEQDPDKSLNEFIRYNVPKLLRVITRKRQKRRYSISNR